MADGIKAAFLRELTKRFGALQKLSHSQSLFELRGQGIRFYLRYSKVHSGNKTFFGLRYEDLQKLEGHTSVLCFLWDQQPEPLLVPFASYEEVFHSTIPAKDGQFKVQVYLRQTGRELYIAKAGRFNVEGHFGWNQLENYLNAKKFLTIPKLTHWQVQTLVGSIGAYKGFQVWVPISDRVKLDWSMAVPFQCMESTPQGFERIADILQK